MSVVEFQRQGVSLELTPLGKLRIKSAEPLTLEQASQLKANRNALIAELNEQEDTCHFEMTIQAQLEPLLPLSHYTLNELGNLYTYALYLTTEYGCLHVHCDALIISTRDPLLLVKTSLTQPWGKIHADGMIFLCKWGNVSLANQEAKN